MYKTLIIGAAGAFLLISPIGAASAKMPAASPAASLSGVSTQKMAMNQAKRGDREVHALNALEAAGYRQFENLHAQGADFVGTAQKAGKTYEVTVLPSGKIEAASA